MEIRGPKYFERDCGLSSDSKSEEAGFTALPLITVVRRRNPVQFARVMYAYDRVVC